MHNKHYIAYGSNMNLEQMAHRCPTARPVGPVVLQDYQLLFRGGRSSAVATIEPSEGKSVPCLLWEITPADEAALDRYEGFPIFYRKETVTFKHKNRIIQAMVYIMNEGRPLGKPSCYYYSTILEGYRSAGFDVAVLKQAVEDSTEDSDGQ